MTDQKAMEYAHPKGRLTKPVLAVLILFIGSQHWVFAQDSDPESATEAQSQAPAEAEDEGPRVRRLGDVDSDEFKFELAVPQAAQPVQRAQSLPLGDPELEATLQEALSILAIREGDPQATAEVQAVLDTVLERAAELTRRGDYEQAMGLLNVVRQVDPNKAGLSEAWTLLAEAQKAPATRPEEPRQSSPEQQWSQSKSGTVRPENAYELPNPAQAERLDQLLVMIAARPNGQAALAELDALLEDLLRQARTAIADGDYDSAAYLVETVRDVNPRKRGLSELIRTLNQSADIQSWLTAARLAEQKGALIEPRLDSAYYHYRRVLTVDPTNAEALSGITAIQQVMVVYALDAARNLDFELAEAWLTEASGIQQNQGAVVEGRRQIEAFRSEMAQGIEQEVIEAIRAGDNNLAEFKLIDLIALGGYESLVTELRDMMVQEESYGQYEPGEIIQDPFTDGSGFAPAVVVVSAGSFMMGSGAGDDDSQDNEKPEHRVTFERGFALGQQEVTVGQFAVFIEDTGYRTDAERSNRSAVWDEDMGQLVDRDGVNWRMDFSGEEVANIYPVLHVSYNDALAYVRWLSSRTNESYRLPSEAEFEYAIRAGSRSAYWWGDGRPRDPLENLSGSGDASSTGRRFSNPVKGYEDGNFGPAPVGSFVANPFGFYDLAGNVSEWVQDCWHANYVRAPVTGVAWDNPGCDRRVVRGGYWASSERQARSASRMSAPQSLKGPQLGFRIARDLW